MAVARAHNRGLSRLVRADRDRYFLLDIERDLILSLNAVGAEMWQLLSAGQPESEIISGIAQKYRVSEQRVATDFQKLLTQIEGLKLTPSSLDASEPGETSQCIPEGKPQSVTYPWYGAQGSDSPKSRFRDVLTAYIGLACFDLVLSLFSLKVLSYLVTACPVWKRETSDPDAQGRLCSAVREACIWYPKKAMCLQRSAVTTCLLRIHGVRATMRIGICPAPFFAHAWVEVGGSVLNDWPGVVNMYRSVFSC